MAGLVTIATFDNRPSAWIAWSILDQHGIPAFLADDNFLNLSWHLNLALGGIRLAVPEEEMKAAEDLLDTANCPPDTPKTALDVCPSCGSTDIFRPYSWTGFAIAMALGAVPFYIRSQRRFCRHCKNRWNAER